MTDVGQTRTPSKPAKGKEKGGNMVSGMDLGFSKLVGLVFGS